MGCLQLRWMNTLTSEETDQIQQSTVFFFVLKAGGDSVSEKQ